MFPGSPGTKNEIQAAAFGPRARGDLRLGIDIGSLTLKLVALDAADEVLFSCYVRHDGRPMKALARQVQRLSVALSGGAVRLAITGSGRGLLPEGLGAATINEIVAHSAAAVHVLPGARTLVEIGGQDSKLVRLDGCLESGGARILSQAMNDVCAAGTGAVVEQQAERLGVELAQFGPLALQSRSPAAVAGRCAVFARTDIIHLRQDGADSADIAAGICQAVVRNVIGPLSGGHPLEGPVVFQGGLAANAGVVAALRLVVGGAEDAVLVPSQHKIMGALGAALLARSRGGAVVPLDVLRDSTASAVARPTRHLPPLPPRRQPEFTDESCPGDPRGGVFVGIDVGSISTCVALLDTRGRPVARSYLLNEGRVLDSVAQGLEQVRGELEEEPNVLAVGVTGSGRALVSHLVGADTVRDEITAQACAAAELVPGADTVFEIGGLDAKYIALRDGRVADFEMNKVCSAGTGSFLQEQSERIGVPMDQMAAVAQRGRAPADLGCRCTVFMESDLVCHQQAGVDTDDLVAGLSLAVVRNYLEKVVAGRKIGRKVVFLGGVARNHSVTSAFEQVLERQVITPPHHDVSAALGAALLAAEAYREAGRPTSRFRGFGRRPEQASVNRFRCNACENSCRVSRTRVQGETFFHGGGCDLHEQKNAGCGGEPSVPDLLARRRELLLADLRPPPPGARRIGLPRAQFFHELAPLCISFLQELGYGVELAPGRSPRVLERAVSLAPVDACLPVKLAYADLEALRDRGVTRVLFPSVVEFERRVDDTSRNHACPHLQVMPDMAGAVVQGVELLSPVLVRHKKDDDWREAFLALGRQLGHRAWRVRRAVGAAARAQARFTRGCQRLGTRALAQAGPEQTVAVLLGKPYGIHDPRLNLELGRRLRQRGVLAIPYDCLPLSGETLSPRFVDMIWANGQDLLRAAQVIVRDARLHPVVVTSFGCGPDSFILKYTDELLQDRCPLVLEVDEHTSAVGVTTRVEAFLASRRDPRSTLLAPRLEAFKPYLPRKDLGLAGRTLYVPIGFDSYRPIAAAFESIGVHTELLPEHDSETQRLGRRHSSGSECLPYIMHVGDAVRMTRLPDFDPQRSALFIPASDLSCRVSVFSTSIRMVLGQLGCPEVPLVAPRLSMDTDEILRVFGMKLAVNLFRGMLAVELLGRLLIEVRPHETTPGSADRAYVEGRDAICASLTGGGFFDTIEQAAARLYGVPADRSRRRPVVGLIGDDYTRGNPFANNELVRMLERHGVEVRTVPIWATYLEFQMGRKPQKTRARGQWLESLLDQTKGLLGKADQRRVTRAFAGRLHAFPDPSFKQMLASAGAEVQTDAEPVLVLALAHARHLLDHQVDGLIDVVGFHCMIHGIAAARTESMCRRAGVPFLRLSFDFLEQVHQENRVEAFLDQVIQRCPPQTTTAVA